MKIAIVGLGKMGSQLAIRLQQDHHEVVGVDADEGVVQAAKDAGIQVATSRDEAIVWFGDTPPIVWLMIPAGVVRTELDEWLKLLPENSTIVDGGNSDYRDTRRHFELAAERHVHFIDVGTSGGIMGLEQGFSLMIGGLQEAVKPMEPVFVTLAKPRGAYQHFGPSGAGHFIKMVHNAIEYGMMQSLAEGYHLLHDGPYEGIDLPHVAQLWQHGSIVESKLNGLIAIALKADPTLEGIEGYVAESGEARWALETAGEHGISMPAVQASLEVRMASQDGETNYATKVLAALRNRFGGHTVNRK
jgi:6-phosphogluconate dehydrogenase